MTILTLGHNTKLAEGKGAKTKGVEIDLKCKKKKSPNIEKKVEKSEVDE